jgi:sugar phosphate isomerase/epimerase
MFAVSTLGCPGMSLPEVGELLRRHGVSGVQLRCAADEPVHVGLGARERRTARRQLEDGGLTVVGLATYVRLSDGVDGLAAHLELAHDLGAPALRLFPGDDLGAAAQSLREAVRVAAGSGVRLLVETHDALLRGADLRRLLEAATPDEGAAPPVAEDESGTTQATRGSSATQLGAVWDALHPWRAGETPAETAAALGPWLSEVQIKDVATPADLTPLVPGTGTVPLREVLGHFDAQVVLEHEARWYPAAAPISAAIDGALRLLRAE